MIGNGVKINPANNNLMIVLSMSVKLAMPPQTPPIMLLLCLYNLFIIILMWSEVGGFDLRASFRSPLQMVTPT